MKDRRVTLTLQVETDAPLPHLRKPGWYYLHVARPDGGTRLVRVIAAQATTTAPTGAKEE